MEELLAHSTWVWRLARRLVDDDELAHDVVQETWVRALRRPPELADDASPRPWLQVVVRNIAAQFRRADQRRAAREHGATKPEAQPSVDRVRAREEARRVVVEAVLALPEPYREAVVLRYFDELSPAAIAKQLGVPGSTVRTRLQRAHALLRARLTSQRRDGASDWLAALIPLIPRRGPWVALSSGALLMTGKLVVSSAAAIAAALLVWLVVSSKSLHDTSSVASVAPDTAPSDAHVEASDAASARTATADAQLAAVAPTASGSASSLVHVRVVERATGEALPGAMVLFASNDVLDHESADLERNLQVHGDQLVADANGECEFPYRGSMMRCAARSGDLWGQTAVTSARGESVLLELVRDREVDVQVVDRDGRPVAGVPLVLTSLGSSTSIGSTDGPQGLARIRHFDVVAPRPSQPSELVVTFAFPLAESRGVRIDLAALPLEPLRLELPPHGSLRLRLQHPGGERVPARYSVSATFRQGTSNLGATSAEDAELVVPFVGLGLELRLFGHTLPPGELDDFSCAARGPERESEERLVEVEIPRRVAAPHARIVDAASAPVANRALYWWLHSQDPDDPGKLGRSSTDERGEFQLDVARKHLQDVALELRVLVVAEADEPALEAASNLPASRVPRDADLGLLQAAPQPSIASGVVLDDRELPVARADVELMRRNPLVTSDVAQPKLTNLGYTMVAQEWDPVRLRVATSDDHGHFVIGGEDRAGELALRVQATGYAKEALVPIEHGATGVVIHLARSGGIAGSLRLPHPSCASALRVVVDAAGDDDASHGASAGVAFDGCFRIESVPAGPQRFSIHLNRPKGELLAIDGVVAEAGEIVRDPRLADIDLRGLVNVFEIEVVSESGAPVDQSGVFYARLANGPDFNAQAFIRAGHATVVSELRELDLLTHAPGFRVREQHVSAGPVRVELAPGIELALRLADSLELGPDLAIEARLHAPGETQSYDEFRPRVPREGARVRLPFEGEWTVEWIVVDRAKQSDRTLRSDKLDVRNGPTSTTAVLDVTREQIDEALAPRAKRNR